MKDNDSKPEPQSSGNRPPPRPPKHTALALGPDDDDAQRKQPKKDTVRINLPPKPSAVPTIKLPTLPPGQFPIEPKLPKKSAIPSLALRCHPRVASQTLELSMVLAAVLLLNGMLFILRFL